MQNGRVLSKFQSVFSVCIGLDQEYRQQNPVVMKADVQALNYENTSKAGVVIYTNRSVDQYMRSSWAYVVQVGGSSVREYWGAFALTTSSLTMKIMAVTNAMDWLESQIFSLMLPQQLNEHVHESWKGLGLKTVIGVDETVGADKHLLHFCA